ncbi:MAG: acetamidase/formamidase family protein [Defluviitaleaceae bacterium]|nr:acetamidase/formamidase family protein [Defluviitaleaceae bacterium]
MKTISRENVIYSMSAKNKPVEYANPGEQLLFETWDALQGQIKSENDEFGSLDWDRVNPATGPVYVNGAEPGDILAVRIDRIDVDDSGVVLCGKGMGVMGNHLEAVASKIIPIQGGKAIFSDKIKLPLNKMVGVIGTAPRGEDISCGTPDAHGGNMDCKEVREGATILLPVNVPGGLLALGDLHAVMADGEIGVSGLEVSGQVLVTVDVIKGKKLPTPMIRNGSHMMTLYSDADLNVAADMAVANMVNYLEREAGFTPEDATMLVSLAGDVRICQIVDPKKTVRVEMPIAYVGRVK